MAAEEVNCQRCGNPGAKISSRVPFRGELKERVTRSICQDCWNEWVEAQVKVINELALNLGDPRSHDIVEDHARQFFGWTEEGTDASSTDPGNLPGGSPFGPEA